jgi:starch-binding outer membrane protein, SusD/RagB family
MKNNIIVFITTLCISILSSGCEEYLDVPPDAQLTEEVIFSDYNSFQGFLDTNYEMVSDPNNTTLVVSGNMACESASNSSASPAFQALNCNYQSLGQTGRSVFQGFSAVSTSPFRIDNTGIYDWWPYGCRISNIALQNLKFLKIPENKNDPEYNQRVEEKNRIEGQALFFRAYFNFSVLCAYGSIPYLDDIYVGDNVKQPRYYTFAGKKNYQAASEKAVADLRRAADLLPVSWASEQNNLGRITKGAALGLLTKVLLYAGSPLMEEVANSGIVSSADTEYNKDYLRRAAETAVELFNLNAYQLTPFGNITERGNFKDGDGYRKMFTTIDGTIPYTTEVIFKRWGRGVSSGKGLFENTFGRIYGKGDLSNVPGGLETPLIEFMDKFEMRDGSQYKPGNSSAIISGFDDNKFQFFYNRDPRFDYNYYLHDEKVGTFICNFEDLGRTNFNAAKGPFMMTKFWYPEADTVNNQWDKYMYGTPLIRLADVYLMYAEAVFELENNINASIAGGITAVQALNRVRERVGMPNYNPTTYQKARLSHGELETDNPFRSAYRNERAVELAYEGHLWWDLRRWKRMHRLNDKVSALKFNKDFTVCSRELVQSFQFEMRHYWLPFPVLDTQVYNGFEQNPGW